VPDALVDHILTGDLMVDPVIAEDNRTYDREAICSWFASKERNQEPITSPYSREVMGKSLRPNVDLKRAIDEIKDHIKHQANNRISEAAATSSGFDVVEIELSDVASMKSIHGLNAYFECLDPCREVLESTLDGWTPPCIIMVGAENTGKSSVLERLALMAIFPRMEGICTRLPIHARLRRVATSQPPVLVVYNQKTKQEEDRRVISMHTGSVDVREVMEGVLRRCNGSLTGVDSDRIIILHINSTRVPSLDLIDLPGMVAGSVEGEPSDMAETTRGIVEEHIEAYGDRAIYLCTGRATQDTNKDSAFSLIQQYGLQVSSG